MKSRVASFLALTILAPAAWTQLFFDDELLWLRPLDFLDPDFASKAPIDAYTFNQTFSKDLEKDGPPLIDVYGSLIFYADGKAILNVGQTSSLGATGDLRAVSMYKPSDGQASLSSTNFNMFFDGVEQPTNKWTLEEDPRTGGPQGLAPPLHAGDATDPRTSDEYLAFMGQRGGGNHIVGSDQIQTFVFWFDPNTFHSGDLYTFGDVLPLTDDGKPADLRFDWQNIQPNDLLGDRSDSYQAISRLQPYGGVIPVPESATYLGASVLLLFIAGHFLHMRRRKKKAAK